MTPTGIEPATFRLVAQCVYAWVLNKYSATKYGVSRKNIYMYNTVLCVNFHPSFQPQPHLLIFTTSTVQGSVKQWHPVKDGCVCVHAMKRYGGWINSSRWVVSFKPQPFYPQGKRPQVPTEWSLMGPIVTLGALEKRKTSRTCRKSNRDFSVVQPRHWIDYSLRLPGAPSRKQRTQSSRKEPGLESFLLSVATWPALRPIEHLNPGAHKSRVPSHHGDYTSYGSS